MATWVLASDFKDRIADLIQALGDIEPAKLAERAGVGAEQVRRWLRGDEVKPRQKSLERWAKREGWPVGIFAEGGPMPSTVVNSAVNKPDEKGSGASETPAGADSIRETRATLAAGTLALGATAASKFLDGGALDDAERTLWDAIGTAANQLKGDEKRRPRVTRAEVDRRKRDVDGGSDE